ncbi:MAG: VanZ family protein [Clostridiales bacterium]|nr:VanZ family protein [Clostridiales bacterium]
MLGLCLALGRREKSRKRSGVQVPGSFLRSGVLERPVIFSVSLTYVLFVLFVTLIARTPFSVQRAELVPLWSWYEVIVNHSVGLFEEIVLNVLMFVPVGVCMHLLHGTGPGKALLAGLVFSALIEMTQLLTCRGLFEWDDMIHNALGCWIGCLCVRGMAPDEYGGRK